MRALFQFKITAITAREAMEERGVNAFLLNGFDTSFGRNGGRDSMGMGRAQKVDLPCQGEMGDGFEGCVLDEDMGYQFCGLSVFDGWDD